MVLSMHKISPPWTDSFLVMYFLLSSSCKKNPKTNKQKKKTGGRGEVEKEQNIRLTSFNCNRNEGKTNHTFLSFLPVAKRVFYYISLNSQYLLLFKKGKWFSTSPIIFIIKFILMFII